MAIVKMNNFSLFAFDSERDKLLKKLQNFGYVHFSNPDEGFYDEELESLSIPESIGQVNEEISKVKYSIDLLSRYYVKETGIKAMIKGMDTLEFQDLEDKALAIDYKPTYDKLRDLALNLEDLVCRSQALEEEKEELLKWEELNYPIEELEQIKEGIVFTGSIPKKMKDSFKNDILDFQLTHVEAISEDKDCMYFLAIAWKDELEEFNNILRNNGFTATKLLGRKSPSEEIILRDKEAEYLEEEGSRIEEAIKDLLVHLPDFEIVYEYLMNKKLRLMVSENFFRTETVNIINGYIPRDRKDDFIKAVDESLAEAYYLDIKEADDSDPDVPVLLENSKFNENFESLTEMYALPKYNEIDPTPFLAPFYVVFFGMMGADLGYGLLMLIGTIVVLKSFNLDEGSRKFVKFFHYLSYSVIFWGILYGSIFGGIIEFPVKPVFNPAEEYNTILILSIIFGIFHIFYGLGIKAYMHIRDGEIMDAVYDVGLWILALVGAIGFLLPMVIELPAIVKTVSLVMMIIGMGGIVLFGARDAKGLGRIAGGAYELYGISGYIGDFVSYSRLMALGLSGGFIAGSINLIAGMVAKSGPVGIFFGAIIFIFGQLFNLALSLLSAYVHTVRLTFVEFFGKFYEGGGRKFETFRSNTKYINIK